MDIYVNDIKVPFADRLSLRFYNPLFNDIAGHSFPVVFNPQIPLVKQAFGFPGEQDNDFPTTAKARIRCGLLDIEGEWQITEASKIKIEAYYKCNSGDFYSMIGEKLLTEMAYGGVKYPAGALATVAQVLAHMDTKMDASYPDDDYAAFCAYMPKAYGDDTESMYTLVNEIEWDESGDPTFKDKGGNQGNDTVYLFIGTVIDYIFEEFGYRIARNVFRTDPQLQKKVIYNTYNRKSYPAFDYSKLVPAIKIGDFLKAITNRFNIGFFIDEGSKTVEIIFFDDLINKGVKSLATKFISQPVTDNRRTTGLIFPLNAPDDWSDHKFKGESDFEPFTPIAVNKLRDIVPGALTNGNVYFVKAESAYYNVAYIEGDYVAVRKCMRNFPYNPGSAGKEITQYSGIPGMFTYVGGWSHTELVWDPELGGNVEVTTETSADLVMPRCDLECTDTLNNTGFSLMFLSAAGIQESYVVPVEGGPATLKYPLGTNDIYDAEGAAITGIDLAFNWNEDNGLIAFAWENRINWEMNLKKTVKASLSNDDPDQLINFAQAVRVENNNYLVNVVDMEIEGDLINIEEAELLRL